MEAAYRGMTADQRALVEEEDRYRRLFAEDRWSHRLSDPHLMLHDVFALSDDQWEYQSETDEEAEVPKLLEQHRDANLTGRAIVSDMAEFRENWNEFTGNMFDGLDWNNVFVAGGSVLGPLTNKGGENEYGSSDVDVFIHGITDESEANRKLKHIHSVIQQNTGSQGVVIRTKRTVTVINDYPYRHVQIILRLYRSPAEVLLGFDIDCCTLGYDGEKVWAMERGRRALVRRYNLANETRRSTTYESRLYKYGKRGFAVAVPDLDKSRVNPNLYGSKPWQVTGLAKLVLYDHRESNPDDVDEEEPDESDYNGELSIPYGPGWTAATILAKLNSKDKSQYFANKFREMRHGDYDGRTSSSASSSPHEAHKHLFVPGIDELIQGEFWCQECAQRMQLPEDVEGDFVPRRISWLKDCPAYQDIDHGYKRPLMTGSFRLSLDPDWRRGVYSGEPASLLLTSPRGTQRPAKAARRTSARLSKRFPRGSKGARKQPRFVGATPTKAPFAKHAVGAPAKTLPAVQAPPKAADKRCDVCHMTFPSENVLRTHVKVTGHVAPSPRTKMPTPAAAPPASSGFQPSAAQPSRPTLQPSTTTATTIASATVAPPTTVSGGGLFVSDLSQFGPQPGTSAAAATAPISSLSTGGVYRRPTSPSAYGVPSTAAATTLAVAYGPSDPYGIPSTGGDPYGIPSSSSLSSSAYYAPPSSPSIYGVPSSSSSAAAPRVDTAAAAFTSFGSGGGGGAVGSSSSAVSSSSLQGMNANAKALYLISRCFKSGLIDDNERTKLKEAFIKGNDIISASVEVFEIDNDLNEFADTLKRVVRF